MVSIKTFALAFMVSAVHSQTLYSCWCGPNQGESRAACGRMADSGWMEGGRCIVMGDRARDYWYNTACTYGPGSECISRAMWGVFVLVRMGC
ncbi:hypothetical protein C8035_v010273 [Colletotrichum spinosum]|uniref:Secreted protein n=1 Tax=Colletotrichum spinosum TaxID=1347390 RepID=A0A4R8QH53_9PEZI|nr:hypothetical protein C8035_v010273 [Colletotrichum spinosum]